MVGAFSSIDSDRAIMSRKARMELFRKQAEDNRNDWDPFYRDVERFVTPGSTQFEVTERNDGKKKSSQDIIDGTATFAARIMSAGMHSGLSNPASVWFRLGLKNKELTERHDVRAWLNNVRDIMLDIFNGTNFYDVSPIVYEDVGTHGTSAVLSEPDVDEIMRYYHLPTGSYSLSSSNKLKINGMVREYSFTIQQMAEEFGVENLPDAQRDMARRGNWGTWIDIIHVIAPNDLFDPLAMDAKFKRFASVHYVKGDTQDGSFLRESGVANFRMLTPRWSVRGTDIYGSRSPARIALGDIKQLQVEEKGKLRAIEQGYNPTLVAPATMENQPISTLPGHTIFTPENEKGDRFKRAFEFQFDLANLIVDEDNVRGRINRAFYVDLFLALLTSSRQQTATEVEEKVAERLLALGPVIGKATGEFLKPAVELLFEEAASRGLFPDAPEAIQDEELTVEFIGLLAQAQKLAQLENNERLVAFVANIATLFPEVIDKVKWDETVDKYADDIGADPDQLNDAEEVRVVREQRAALAAQVAELEAANQVTAAAKNLSQADTSGQNALTDVIGSVT